MVKMVGVECDSVRGVRSRPPCDSDVWLRCDGNFKARWRDVEKARRQGL